MNRIGKGFTLIELLISICLLSVIVLGFSSINLFTNFQVMSSDRRAKLQNEVSLVLEHMAKQISRAIGSTVIPGQNPIDFTPIVPPIVAVRAYVDSDASNGPGDGIRDTVNDHWIAYRFTGNIGAPSTRFQIWYYPNYVNPGDPHETIASYILSSPILTFTGNYLSVQITACWDPLSAESVDNPCVTMRTRIKMPSVSLN